jgi:hypothetical protein
VSRSLSNASSSKPAEGFFQYHRAARGGVFGS